MLLCVVIWSMRLGFYKWYEEARLADVSQGRSQCWLAAAAESGVAQITPQPDHNTPQPTYPNIIPQPTSTYPNLSQTYPNLPQSQPALLCEPVLNFPNDTQQWRSHMFISNIFSVHFIDLFLQ